MRPLSKRSQVTDQGVHFRPFYHMGRNAAGHSGWIPVHGFASGNKREYVITTHAQACSNQLTVLSYVGWSVIGVINESFGMSGVDALGGHQIS